MFRTPSSVSPETQKQAHARLVPRPPSVIVSAIVLPDFAPSLFDGVEVTEQSGSGRAIEILE
jgi:hypothetical protein